MPTLNESVILAAIEGFESQKNRIDQQIAELRAILPGSSKAGTDASQPAPRKRHFSPEAVARMREAQQRRWAKVRGESEPSTPAASPEPATKRHKMSAAGRKAISKATKRRWALKRAEAAKAQAPAAKRSVPARKKATARKAVRKEKTATKRPVQTASVATLAPTATE